MIEDVDGFPSVGSSARRLGVRGHESNDPDIQALVPSDVVDPQFGGMSVAPDEPRGLHPIRLPRSLGGRGRDPVWVIEESDLGPDLTVVRDKPGHALIVPVRPTTRDAYERALASTRDKWRLYSR
jgi:hypothetical protein